MNEATSQVEVRDLEKDLRHYLDRVRGGDEVIVTDQEKPIARLTAIDASTDPLAALIAAGIVRVPRQAERSRSARRITPTASVSDLVPEQRR